MKQTLTQILNANSAIISIATKELPSKVSYQLSRLQSKLLPILTDFDKSRIAIFKKYGTEKDNQFTILPENIEVAQKELNELVAQEEEITYNPIKLELFEGQNLSSNFFSLMNLFIEE